MDKKSEEYLSQYIKLTDKIKQKIESHANIYNIKAEICAWYSDWEDFCSDWCDECGDEVKAETFNVGNDLDEDYMELWKDRKIEKARENYP